MLSYIISSYKMLKTKRIDATKKETPVRFIDHF